MHCRDRRELLAGREIWSYIDTKAENGRTASRVVFGYKIRKQGKEMEIIYEKDSSIS